MAVGLPIIGSELGQKLVVGNPGGGVEARLRSDFGSDLEGDVSGERHAPKIFGDVEIGFVERKRLDERSVLREDRTNLLRYGAIDIEPRRHEHQLRAFAQRRA